MERAQDPPRWGTGKISSNGCLMSDDWSKFASQDQHADEIPHKNRHELSRERVESVIDALLAYWDSYLPRTFSIEIKPSEQFWKLVAIDRQRGFRSSGFINKKRCYEQRVQDVVRGLMNDYFIETDTMPLRWGEYI